MNWFQAIQHRIFRSFVHVSAQIAKILEFRRFLLIYASWYLREELSSLNHILKIGQLLFEPAWINSTTTLRAVMPLSPRSGR